MESTHLRFPGIVPFDLEVYYAETHSLMEETHFDAHTHPFCEIYINLSGDISFMVENHIYPIRAGSVILTRPNEFHHCIYNSFSDSHRHFCIQFSANGNERLLSRFYDRPIGTGNLIFLGTEALGEICAICRTLASDTVSELERFGRFFRLLSVLESSHDGSAAREEAPMYEDVRIALDHISEHIASPLTVKELASVAHVSVNTLERHFLSAMNVTPSEFLKERRLALAKTLLREGRSVMEAAEESGFSDYSHFIALFRRRFGITPLQYKRKKRNT